VVASSTAYSPLDWTLVALTGLGGFVAAYFVVRALVFSVITPARAASSIGRGRRRRRIIARELRVREPHLVDAALFAGQQQTGMVTNRVAVWGSDPMERDAFEGWWRDVMRRDPDGLRTIVFRGRAVGYIEASDEGDSGGRELRYAVQSEAWDAELVALAIRERMKELPRRLWYARVNAEDGDARRVLKLAGFRRKRAGETVRSKVGRVIELVVLERPA
jgi:hypothetical protein